MSGAPQLLIEAEDFEDAIERFHQAGWTDGLPIVPPTPRRLVQFCKVAGRSPADEIGLYEVRNRPITVEKVAINAIMAGCLPEHFTVVLAIVECLLDPDFAAFHTANSSTGSLALGFIVNGPIRHALGMNFHGNVLGPGNRANSSIGRAVRLIQINVFGSVPGAGVIHPHGRTVLDRSTMGRPEKYSTFHVVENEEDFPSLIPVHVGLGYAPTDSVVTVFNVAGDVMLNGHAETTPEAWTDTMAHYLVGQGRLMPSGAGVFLIPPEAAQMFVAAGWSKADIAKALYEKTRRSLAWNKTNGWKVEGRMERGGPVLPGDEDKMLAMVGRPEDLLIAVCGGPAGNFPVYLFNYANSFGPVSRKIRC